MMYNAKTIKEPIARKASHVWMYSFTDMLLILITFFVMLAALGHEKIGIAPPEISAPYEDLNSNAALAMREEIETEPQNMRYDTMIRGVNLDYLAVLLGHEFDEMRFFENNAESSLNNASFDVHFTRQSDRLVVSMPSDLLFQSGGYALTEEGRIAIGQVAQVLKRLRNQVVVYGHADPSPTRGGAFSSNWELSMARALSVAGALVDSGYNLPVRPHGLSSSRFDELPEDLPEAERFALARRVDIVVLADGVRLY